MNENTLKQLRKLTGKISDLSLMISKEVYSKEKTKSKENVLIIIDEIEKELKEFKNYINKTL